jgi:hypothetical protein
MGSKRRDMNMLIRPTNFTKICPLRIPKTRPPNIPSNVEMILEAIFIHKKTGITSMGISEYIWEKYWPEWPASSTSTFLGQLIKERYYPAKKVGKLYFPVIWVMEVVKM